MRVSHWINHASGRRGEGFCRTLDTSSKWLTFTTRQHGTALVYHLFPGDRTPAAASFCMWSLNSVTSEHYRHNRWVELSKTCQQRSWSCINAFFADGSVKLPAILKNVPRESDNSSLQTPQRVTTHQFHGAGSLFSRHPHLNHLAQHNSSTTPTELLSHAMLHSPHGAPALA